MDEWHFTMSNEKYGPVSFEKIKELASAGTLKPTDYLWKQGMAGWAVANSIEGLFVPDLPPAIPTGGDVQKPATSRLAGMRAEAATAGTVEAARARAKSSPVFWLCELAGCAVFVATAKGYFDDDLSSFGMATLVAALIYSAVAPFVWNLADDVRAAMLPDMVIARGFSGLVRQKIFWMWGPQAFSLAAIVILSIIIIDKQRPTHSGAIDTTSRLPTYADGGHAAEVRGTLSCGSATCDFSDGQLTYTATPDDEGIRRIQQGCGEQPCRVGVKVKDSDILEIFKVYGPK